MKRTTKKTFLCALFTFGLLHNPLAQDMSDHLVNMNTKFNNKDIQDKHIRDIHSNNNIGKMSQTYNLQVTPER